MGITYSKNCIIIKRKGYLFKPCCCFTKVFIDSKYVICGFYEIKTIDRPDSVVIFSIFHPANKKLREHFKLQQIDGQTKQLLNFLEF